MDRNAIISSLFRGKNFNDCISKMEPAHLRDDLKQEVALVMCSMPDDQLTMLHREQRLEFYIVRVIINMVSNKYSQFYKQFRQINYQLMEDVMKGGDEDRPPAVLTIAEPEVDFRDREIREQLEDIALDQINHLYWYDKEMVLLYLKHQNFRALETETKIPFTSCYNTVKKALVKLKKISIQKAEPVFSREELKSIQL